MSNLDVGFDTRSRDRQYERKKAAKANLLARPRPGNLKQCGKTESTELMEGESTDLITAL